MKLLTKEIEDRFKKIGSQENSDDPEIVVKFFDPTSSWKWYATEYDPKNKILSKSFRGQINANINDCSADRGSSPQNQLGAFLFHRQVIPNYYYLSH